MPGVRTVSDRVHETAVTRPRDVRRAGDAVDLRWVKCQRDARDTSIRYAERLSEEKAVRSVGSKGDSYDNAAAESLDSLTSVSLSARRKTGLGSTT
jgi:hypothetical protein